ncbi:MAG: diguanylate cyclase, partial [Oscillospiraceae bacterium]
MDCQNKILIVDDSNVNRMLLRRILEDTYDIAEAENGRRALDLLSSSETRFSAVLLDILMPVMNGFDFLQLVRKDSSMSSLPVVVITEADDIDTELTALKLGATDFLKKPYEPMIIRQRLDNIIKLKAFMDNETRSEQEKVLINNIPCCVAICEISDTVKMRYISEGIENISGFSAAEFKEKFAQNALASLHPRFREKLLHELIQCAEKHEPIDVEYLAFRKDGHERWTKMSGKYAGEDNGSTLYYCVLTDITANKLTETKLALNERQLRLAFDQSALEMLEYDFSTGNLKFTPNSKSNRRPISFKLESKKYARIIHTDSRQAYGKALAELKSGKSPVEVSLQMLRGHYFRWVRFSFSTVIGESGEPEKAIGVCRDITSEVEAEHKYELEASYRRALIEDALVFLEFDLSTEEVLTKNTEFVKSLDLPEGRSLLYQSKYIVQKLIHPDDVYLFEPFEHIPKLSEEIKSGKSEVTIECRSRSASHIYRDYHWVSLSFSFIVNPTNDHPHMFICVRDINDSKLRQLKIIDKSQRDSLTGVYNRATFVDLTVDALIRCREEGLVSAFMIVDIDDFKVINDTHGHAIGDEVLSILGSRLRSLFRKNDIIGRLGGDEFVVFLPHIPSEELALSKGMAVCKAMASWREKISMTCSAGIAISPQFGDTFETLYANADLALYRAKMLGKNTCCLYDGESCAPILENKLDKNQLFEALDDIVHVIDVENLELLYANDRAKKAFNLPPDYVGRTCYGTLYNRSTPCPYCTNKYLSFDKFYIWEHDSSGLNSRFIVKNKLIRWSGRTARLEIAIDINNSTTRQALDDGLKQQEAIAEEKYMFLLDNTDISSFDYDALTDTMHYVSRSVGEKAAERAIPNYSEYVMSSGAIHSDDTEILIACLSSHVPNLTEGHVIIRYRQDCESFTALSVNYICLCNDSGSPYRVIGKYHVANRSDLTDADTSTTATDSQDTHQKQTMLLANLSEDRRADLADLFRSDCAIIETYDQASTEEALNRRDDISIVLLDNDKLDKVCLDILNSISLIPRL